VSTQLHGLPAAPGVATGVPWIHRPPEHDGVAMRSIADAAEAAAAELERLAAGLRDEGRPDEAEILDAQALMAIDEELLGAARDREASGGVGAGGGGGEGGGGGGGVIL
jgi:PEP-utilising enzyme, N-terminal